jgi:anti-anti-sigma factor
MPVEKWSDRVVVARLADDPQLTEDLLALDQSANHLQRDIVLDFSAVNYLNSSHLSRLLKLRKKTLSDDGRLMLCGLGNQVWGAFMVTGLDKIFHFADSVSMALATLQIEQ